MPPNYPAKLRFGFPSSSKSPTRFTVSFKIDAPAKIKIPTSGDTNGIASNAEIMPAIFPRYLRILRAFIAPRHRCQLVAVTSLHLGSDDHPLDGRQPLERA